MNNIVEINNLTKNFPSKDGDTFVKAVGGVSFKVREGETFGLVGESGCGKTTLGRCVVKGIEASSGEVMYNSEEFGKVDFLNTTKSIYQNLRREISLIFQDPYQSLNPRMTVFDIISEPLRTSKKFSKKEIEEKVSDMAKKVGLNVSYLSRYPHAFSGGQRQRVGIARSLITAPKFIVCDEAVSALDVSIQAQIINLLQDMQKDMKLTYLFISHDLSVVKHISDRVGVMYLGRIVEIAETDSMFSKPLHPYTEALLSAVPKPDPRDNTQRIVLEGEVPNPANPPKGCHFNERCKYAKDICRVELPELEEKENGRFVACHFSDELELKGVF